MKKKMGEKKMKKEIRRQKAASKHQVMATSIGIKMEK